MLSKRLKTITTLIEPNRRVVDVGCDHALIDIYLTKNGLNKCIASDINKKALEGAIKNIKKYHLEGKIETVISNGVNNIQIDKNDYIVISGMGTRTIIKILENEKVKKIENLILSSHNEYEYLRYNLKKKNFYIEDEIIVKERGIYYLIMKLNRIKKMYKKEDYYLGPILKNKQDLETKEYFIQLYNSNKNILEKLPKKYIFRRSKLKKYNRWLKKYLY